MNRYIGLVLKLLWDPGSRNSGLKLQGFLNGTFHPFLPGCQHQFRAKKPDQATSFNRHGFGHHDNDLIPFVGTDKRKPYTGISRCGFNNGSSGLQDPFFLRIFNHCQSNTIFDTPYWILSFQFNPYFVMGEQLAQTYVRCIPD
ncbi:hypothetical protein SDC9_88898 [bioreactor metagenome]|uniref:Uncharacterized protein n=1 Tax=bioreactor metagenome TaxID=1076179 RepID=A0A644ZUA1_9ZZZZ